MYVCIKCKPVFENAAFLIQKIRFLSGKRQSENQTRTVKLISAAINY